MLVSCEGVLGGALADAGFEPPAPTIRKQACQRGSADRSDQGYGVPRLILYGTIISCDRLEEVKISKKGALVSVVRDDLRRRCRHSVVAEVPERSDARQLAESSEARWHAAWLLRQLSPGQSAPVLLVDLDGYTIDEAAAVLVEV
jgi:hypothetical protein